MANKKQIKIYEPTKNNGYNTLKQNAIKHNGIQDMTCLLDTIKDDTIIKACLKLQACKIVKSDDTIYFLVIHATNPLNQVVTKAIYGNNKNYNTIYKNMPIVNMLCNRIRTLSHGMSYNHPMKINENLRQHLIDKKCYNKKYVYAIGISNSMIDYEKFINIIGHEYWNKDDIKTNIRKYNGGI